MSEGDRKPGRQQVTTQQRRVHVENHDEDPDEKRFIALIKALFGAYMTITDMLTELPLPIRIPLMDEDWEPRTALPALDRVRTVIRDEPLPDQTAALINTLILDWLAAYDATGVVQELGDAPWRIDALEAAMTRVAFGIYLVTGLLRRTDGE
jgi:hypothetical protein